MANKKCNIDGEYYESPKKYKLCPVCFSGMEILNQEHKQIVIHCPVCEHNGIGYVWLYGDKWLEEKQPQLI